MYCLDVITVVSRIVCWIIYQEKDCSHFQLIPMNDLIFHLALEDQRYSYQDGLELLNYTMSHS